MGQIESQTFVCFDKLPCAVIGALTLYPELLRIRVEIAWLDTDPI